MAQQVYAMGIYDASNILFDDDDKESEAVKTGRVKCGAAEKLTPEKMVELVNKAYEDPASSSLPPPKALIGVVSRFCAKYIDEERSRLGS